MDRGHPQGRATGRQDDADVLRELLLLLLWTTVALLHRFSGFAFRAIFQCGGSVQIQVLRVLEMEERYLSTEVLERFIRARLKMRPPLRHL